MYPEAPVPCRTEVCMLALRWYLWLGVAMVSYVLCYVAIFSHHATVTTVVGYDWACINA